ncbi:MAG: PrsW family glutamic-type intramembrane protease [Alphaproteobacteria bacterium]|nr:PrsW family glutamic-type intramembrane protease [Alphaproteobacteria bacterium]
MSGLILVAFTPVFLWIKYLHENAGGSAPARHIWPALLLGVAISYPAMTIEDFLARSPLVSFAWLYESFVVEAVTLGGTFAHYFLRAYVIGGFVEEFLKLMAVLAVLWVFRASVRPVSLLLIAVAVSGGFAAIENILISANAADWGRTALLRTLVSLPTHIFLGVFMGFFLVLAWKWRWRYAMACLAFLVPALLHGTSNYLLAIGETQLGPPPGAVHAAARFCFGMLLLAEALLAMVAVSRVSRFGAGAKRAVRALGRDAPSVAFWTTVALFVGIIGLVNLLSLGLQVVGVRFPTNVNTTFVIGATSLVYAFVIGGHARRAAGD